MKKLKYELLLLSLFVGIFVYLNCNNDFIILSYNSESTFLSKQEKGEIISPDYLYTPTMIQKIEDDYFIIDNYLYICAAKGLIYKIDYLNDYQIIDSYQVPNDLMGLNNISKIGSYFYITSYTDVTNEINPKIIRIKELEKLIENEYEDLYQLLGFESTSGVPYNITSIDDKYFVTEIDTYNSIISFEVVDDNILNIKKYYGSPTTDLYIKK